MGVWLSTTPHDKYHCGEFDISMCYSTWGDLLQEAYAAVAACPDITYREYWTSILDYVPRNEIDDPIPPGCCRTLADMWQQAVVPYSDGDPWQKQLERLFDRCATTGQSLYFR